jgi:hypothetical protein
MPGSTSHILNFNIKGNKMKQFISLLDSLLSTSVFAAEEKKVCVDKKWVKTVNRLWTKNGKPKQDCKTIKVHKKLDVEDKK